MAGIRFIGFSFFAIIGGGGFYLKAPTSWKISRLVVAHLVVVKASVQRTSLYSPRAEEGTHEDFIFVNRRGPLWGVSERRQNHFISAGPPMTDRAHRILRIGK